MNLFNVMKERFEDLGVFDELEVFYTSLIKNKDDKVIQELISLCDTDYFYVRYNPSETSDQYDVGGITIEFDEESRLYQYTYSIYLSFVSYSNTYLPKIKIEKNELLKAFVDAK